jgi:hypothetical protein
LRGELQVSSTYVDPAFAPAPDALPGVSGTSTRGAGQWQKPVKFQAVPSATSSNLETPGSARPALGAALRKENKQPKTTYSGPPFLRLPGSPQCSPHLNSVGVPTSSPTVPGGAWGRPLCKTLLSSQAQSPSSASSVVLSAKPKGKVKGSKQQSISCLSQQSHRPSGASISEDSLQSTSSVSRGTDAHLHPTLAHHVQTSSSYASAARAPADGELKSDGKLTPHLRVARESTLDTAKSVTSRLSHAQSQDSRLLEGRGCCGQARPHADMQARGLGPTSLARQTVYATSSDSTGLPTGHTQHVSAELRSNTGATGCPERSGLHCDVEGVTRECHPSCIDRQAWTRIAKVWQSILACCLATRGVTCQPHLIVTEVVVLATLTLWKQLR